MSTYESAVKSLQLTLQWAKDQSYNEMANELRKTKMKLANWRQSIMKPTYGRCYRIKEKTQILNGWNFGKDHHFTYEGKTAGRFGIGHLALNKETGELEPYYRKTVAIEHIFNSNEKYESDSEFGPIEGQDIKIFLSCSDLHAVKLVHHGEEDSEDEEYDRRYPWVRSDGTFFKEGCARSVNVYVKLYTGELITLRPVLETSSAEIWNYVASLTPRLKFELYHNGALMPSQGNVAELEIQGLTLIQILQPDMIIE